MIGEYDPCELDEDMANNLLSNSSSTTTISTNGTTAALDNSSLPLDNMDIESTTVVVSSSAAATTLKPIVIKQNGTSKTMSVVHTYNYTGKQKRNFTTYTYSTHG